MIIYYRTEQCHSSECDILTAGGVPTGRCRLKGLLFKQGLVHSDGCDKCNLASNTALRVLYD
jgi:hypothetical protein